ncbi:MAG: hypothetical protein QM751_06135 [Paludibacteraceae bacterium]
MWNKIISIFFGKKSVGQEWTKWLKWLLLILLVLNVKNIYNFIKVKIGIGGLTSADVPAKNGGTISTNYAIILANKLYAAMEGMGTNEQDIDDVYRVLATYPDDLLKVWNAFGTRTYSIFGSPYSFFYSWTTGKEYNLRQWLKSELTASEFLKWDTLFDSAGL